MIREIQNSPRQIAVTKGKENSEIGQLDGLLKNYLAKKPQQIMQPSAADLIMPEPMVQPGPIEETVNPFSQTNAEIIGEATNPEPIYPQAQTIPEAPAITPIENIATSIPQKDSELEAIKVRLGEVNTKLNQELVEVAIHTTKAQTLSKEQIDLINKLMNSQKELNNRYNELSGIPTQTQNPIYEHAQAVMGNPSPSYAPEQDIMQRADAALNPSRDMNAIFR